MTDKLGVALVGLGPGAQPHLQALADLHAVLDVRWAVCRNLANAELGPLNAATTRLTSNLQDVLQDPAVAAVIVATPASTHLEIASACLAAGKHCLVEKPLEVSLARAEQLVQCAQAAERQLGVVLQHRFRPGALRLQQLLDSGELGKVLSASLTVPWWRSQQGYYAKAGRGSFSRDGGGVLLTQAIHAIDLFRSLVGVQSVVAAQALTTEIHAIETEDYASALLTLGNGAPGFLWATTALYPGRAETMELICSRASVRLSGGELCASFHDGRTVTVEAEGKSGSGDNIMDFSHEAHKALISDFIDAVQHQRAPKVSGDEALATHRLIQQILQTAGFPEPPPASNPNE